MTALTRREIETLAACVAACNDGGVFDPLLARLREAWAAAAPEKSSAGGERAGTTSTISEPTFCAATQTVPVSPPAGRLTLRPETLDRIAREDHPQAERIDAAGRTHNRRRRATKAVP